MNHTPTTQTADTGTALFIEETRIDPKNKTVIHEPVYPVFQDNRASLRALAREILEQQELNPALTRQIDALADKTFEKQVAVLESVFDANTIAAVTEKEIEDELLHLLQPYLNSPHHLVVVLDRFILDGAEHEWDNVSRDLSLARPEGGGDHLPRIGMPPIDEQFEILAKRARGKSVILVDDTRATGSTIKYIEEQLEARDIHFQSFIAFSQIGHSLEQNPDARVQVSREYPNFKDAVEGRDLTYTLGGKLLNQSGPATYASKPYLHPFSNGEVISLNQAPDFLTVSANLAEIELDTFLELEELLGEEITFDDTHKAGFAIPHIERDAVPNHLSITYQTKVTDFLITLIDDLHITPSIMIWDADGTLYSHEPHPNEENVLAGRVKESAIAYICRLEGEQGRTIDAEQAAEIYAQCGRHVSVAIAEKYSITRDTYFEETWGQIAPADVIKNHEGTPAVLKNLAEKRRKLLYLVSAAPEPWIRNLVAHLGIQDSFADIMTGHDYGKEDAFREIMARHPDVPATRFMAVGDGDCEINAGERIGMQTKRVTRGSPDLEELAHGIL